MLVLGGALALMGLLALLKLGIELHRLTIGTEDTAAIDLRLRWFEVRRWFAGEPIYTLIRRITYPPQAYAMLWPFLGWLELAAARWLWAITSIVALACLSWLLVRAGGAETTIERAFVVLMLLSMNAVGVTMGNGQLILHILPALVGGLLLLRVPREGIASDVVAALLLLFAAIKPTLTAPFAWVALFTTQRVRPLVLAGAGYVALTLLAASFQPTPVLTLMRQWSGQQHPDFSTGYGDLQSALAAVGLERWGLPASLVVLALSGVWIYRHRAADIWILIGVAALIARMWTYHRVYDDVLIILPMIALFRIAKRGPVWGDLDVKAGVLLGVAIIAMLAPARLELTAPLLFIGGHAVLWLVMLWFLGRAVRSD